MPPTVTATDGSRTGFQPVQDDGRVGNPSYVLRAFRKYAKILRISLIERMVYRLDFIVGTTLRFLPMVTTILLWLAVFAGSGEKEISGFSQDHTIAYLLLVHISRMFSSMPGLAGGISRDIRDGAL